LDIKRPVETKHDLADPSDRPEIIRSALEPNPAYPRQTFHWGIAGPSSKTPPAMYFEPAALFRARSLTGE